MKLKVKYLVLMVIVIVAVMHFRDLQLMTYQLVALVDDEWSAELIANMKVTDVKRANAQLERIIEDIDATIYNPVIIASGSFFSGGRVNFSDAEQAYEQYISFTKTEKKNSAFYEYSMNASLVLWCGGLSDQAMAILDDVDLRQLSASKKDEYHLMKGTYFLSLLQLDAAMAEIQLSEDTYPLIRERVTAFIYALQHNERIDRDGYEAYSDDEQKILPLYANICRNNYLKNSLERSVSTDDEPKEETLLEDETIFESYNAGLISDDKCIKGRVTYNGQPLQGVIVYLDDNPNRMTSGHISNYFSVTDVDGYYELLAYEGDSFIEVAIPWQLCHDKQLKDDHSRTAIVFEDKEAVMNYALYDGAYIKDAEVKDDRLYYEIVDPMYKPERYYDILIGYENPEYQQYSGNAFSTKDCVLERVVDGVIKGNIDLESLRHKMEISYAYSGGMDDFQLENFIEPLYLASAYYLEVAIRSDDGNFIARNGFMNESLRYPIYFDGATLSEGDQLIAKGDMKGALAWFEDHQDRHSLKILTALYKKGYYDEAENDDYPYYHDGIDLDQAIIYAEKLLELSPNESKYLSKLQYLYEAAGRIDDALAILERAIELEGANKYDHFIKGKLMIKQGHFMEGLDEYLNYALAGDEDRFYDYLILGNHIETMSPTYQVLFKDIDRSDFQDFFDDMNRGEYEQAYAQLDDMDDSDMKAFYVLLFKKNFSERGELEGSDLSDYYVKVTQGLQSEALRSVLRELVKYNGWFY